MATLLRLLLLSCFVFFPNSAFVIIGRREVLVAAVSLVSQTDVDTDKYGVFNDGYTNVHRDDATFSIYYRLYNPKSDLNPLVVCHGGPSLPSQYLYPIVPLLKSGRPILFFDQLGCGKSDQPRDLRSYSIQSSVVDLETVTANLFGKGSPVHLFGHSYGGVLAFESQKKDASQERGTEDDPFICKSLILSNAPSSMRIANDDYERLNKENPFTFWNRHVSQAGEPPALRSAMKNAGSVWAGMDVVLDYVAAAPTSDSEFPPSLVLLGSSDFALRSGQGWSTILPKTKIDVLENSAHYPFYEQKADKYVQLIDDFLADADGYA